MVSAAETLRRRIARRQRRSIPLLHEPIVAARVALPDRVPPALLLLFGLAGSTLVHVALLKGASGGRRRAVVAPQRPAEIRVAVVERPPTPPPSVVAAAAEVPAPSPKKKLPRANKSPMPSSQPAPTPELPPVPTPPDAPQIADAPPLLMPGVALSATTAVGGIAVRPGKGGGGAAAPGTPGGGGGDSDEAGGRRLVPGYELTEPPVFLDNVSSAEMRRFYPEEARKAKLEADVRVKLLVDEQGQVARATLVSDPSGAFGRAALKVARLYRFKPARLNDRRVATEIAFVIHFELN